jgi:hypothetical protein
MLTPRAPTFSWKDMLLHSLIPLAAVIAVGHVFVVIDFIGNEFSFAEMLAAISVLPMLTAGLVSYLAQTGRTRPARVLVAAGAPMLAAAIAYAVAEHLR